MGAVPKDDLRADLSDLGDVIVICEALAEVEIDYLSEQFAVSRLDRGKPKGICWSWRERIHPKKARIINREVLAIRVASLDRKEELLSEPKPFWVHDDHYNGYAAVIVRLPLITPEELAPLLHEAHASFSR